jgi:hypothetical protein
LLLGRQLLFRDDGAKMGMDWLMTGKDGLPLAGTENYVCLITTMSSVT